MSVAIRGNVRIGGKVLANTTIGDYVAATGATDTTVLANLVAYLKIQNLWDSVRFFPFKSAQNKGSGTTVYGLGGWTSNNVTLVNGPTWGANGVAFDATDDLATWDATGITSLSDLFFFDVQKPGGASLADTNRFGMLFVGDSSGSPPRFFFCNAVTGALSGETCMVGLTNNTDTRRIGDSDITWSANAKTQIVSNFGSTAGMWKSKVSSGLSKISGTQDFRPSASGFVTNNRLDINAQFSGSSYSNFVATTRVALLACKTSLTQAQRETITDYLDAL